MNSPKRSLGQNFLIDPNYQRKIITFFKSIYKNETLIEIGPGRGALTQHLPKENLVLVEKDNEFVSELRKHYLNVIHEDFLKLDLSYKNAFVIGNLPYNISSQILIKILQNRHQFTHLILMFQKEVATRCVAKAGTKDYGILSFWAQSNAKVKKLFDVPPTAFRPRPRVVSTVLHFELKPEKFSKTDQEFMNFVKLIFSQRRKKISSILKQKKIPVDHELCDKRAEQLSLSEMKDLFSKVFEFTIQDS